ncbi:MAG: winged helix-turn-helix domain-containing protein [Chloroflexi bacterium]|nr:winged helix-turn-helix domain-containing protein [Chloroflexota bacterium]
MRKIEIDDEVFQRLQQLASPLVDTPNSVIRRVLGLDETSAEEVDVRTPGGRLKKGLLMPGEEYELPILEALVELGGSAATSDVMDAIEPKIKDKLTEYDLQPMRENGQVIKWKNRAQFARLRLVRSGDLADNSPRGFWEITDQGRKRVAG